MSYEKAKVPFKFAEEIANFCGVALGTSQMTQLAERLSAWRDEHVEVEMSWMKDALEEIRDHAVNQLREIGVRESKD